MHGESEDELRQKNLELTAISELEREFAELPATKNVEEVAAKKILAITGAAVTTFNTYDPAAQVLRTTAIEIAPGILESLPGAWETLTRLLGMRPKDIRIPVSREMYQDINRSVVGIKKTISEISYGRISPGVSANIQKLSGIDRFIHIAHIIDGELYGTLVIGMRPDTPDPPAELLDSFAHIIAVSLRRQCAERALRESEERFRQITENITTVFYIYERRTGRFIYVSPAYEKVWGRPCQSLLDDPYSYLKAVHPDDQPRLMESIRRDLEEDSFVNEDYRIIRPEGSVRWIHARNFPVYDDKGKVYRVAGLAEDVTELKNSRLALQESEEKYRLIANNTADYIYIFDMDFRLQYISPSVEKMRGFTVEEAMALPLDKHMTPESLAGVYELFNKEMEREAAGTADPGRRVFFETEEYCKDGSTIYVENSVTLLRDAAGRPSGILGISRDISERKRTERALRESEEKFRSLVEHSLEAILVLDFEGTVLFANKATARLIEADERVPLTGRNVMEVVAPESREDVIRDFAQVAQGHDAYLAQYSVISAKGNEVRVESIGKVISYEGRQADLLFLRDITGRRKAEEALRKANRQLSLLSGITRHDILNKTSVILGYLKIAQMKTRDPVIINYLNKIDDTTAEIKSQIEFTRIYQDLGSHEPQWLVLDEVLTRLEVPPAIRLEAGVRGILILADPLLEKVFSNLLDNSLRHGERVSEIRVLTHRSGNDLVVVWEDNGVGIPADEKEKIFDRGFGKNTGLGMFLAREILTLTGITIRETGEQGKGARFEITVPEGAYRVTGG